MSGIQIHPERCTLCEACLLVCPFDALERRNDRIEVNAACKVCRICLKACPEGAIELLSEPLDVVDKSLWKGILVVAEQSRGVLQPVSLELVGKARSLASKIHQSVYALVVGSGVEAAAQDLVAHGVDQVLVYEDEALAHFRVDLHTSVLEDCIRYLMPAVVLIGATSVGRSLAPRAAARFRTGLTADCTVLDIRENTDLVQIRPAFGGNIMAEILTTRTRPQFATVREKVMDMAEPVPQPKGRIVARTLSPEKRVSGIRVLETRHKEPVASITDAEILVAAGRGLRGVTDLVMLEELAGLLGGELACTRGLVEDGWMHHSRQIGLSGRTVKPRLILCCGISGAVQFTAGMNAADQIIAINRDPHAAIFKVAHHGLVGDLYEIIPQLIRFIRDDPTTRTNQMLAQREGFASEGKHS